MMKCPNCGAELSEDTRFCSYCGNKIDPIAVPIVEEVKEQSPVSEVPPVSNNTPTPNNNEAPKAEQTFTDKVKEKFMAFWNKLSLYGKITTVALTVFSLLCLIAFLFGKTGSGIIAIVQIALVVVALLIHKKVIKVPKLWIRFIALGVAAVLLIPYFGAFSAKVDDAEKIDWSQIVLGEKIPEPKSLVGKVLSNHDDYLSIYIHRTSLADYRAYVDECKKFGYTIDADPGEISYYAFNDEGYKLSLFYTESEKEMHIGIDAAEEYGTLTWPTSGLGSLIPAPKSTKGEISQNGDDGFNAYVGDMPIAEYNAYVDTCAASGFNVDANKTEKHYSAKNADGYELTITYQGNNVAYVTIDIPEYAVGIEVECVENWIFSTYDVEVYIDDSFESTITHGDTVTIDVNLTQGKHELKFVSAEDDDLTGVATLHIHKEENLKYKISCSSSGIDVETIVGTTPPKDDSGTNQEGTTSGYTPDYADAETFEAALNNGDKVNGKIVQFVVNAYKPDSALGINCWAGEHLNFISETALDVAAGDVVIGYITAEPSKVLGSWEIDYLVLAINNEKTNATIPSEPVVTDPPETTEPEIATIAMTAASSSYEGKDYSSVKSEIEALGFTSVVVTEKVTTDASHTDGSVISVTIDGAAFSAGDEFKADVEINITFWKVEKPVSEYELAFVRKLGSYSLYYMFDTDTKTVVQFGTDDTYLYKGTYSGNFSSGVTMTWDHGEWTDKFKYSEGSSRATYYDAYGSDWEYTVCDLKSAQDILDTRER